MNETPGTLDAVVKVVVRVSPLKSWVRDARTVYWVPEDSPLRLMVASSSLLEPGSLLPQVP